MKTKTRNGKLHKRSSRQLEPLVSTHAYPTIKANRFRITTNGIKYQIQYEMKKWFGKTEWIDLRERRMSFVSIGMYSEAVLFDSYEEAKNEIRLAYGSEANIASREWRAC